MCKRWLMLAALSAACVSSTAAATRSMEELSAFTAAEAIQAVAVDARYAYAINNSSIGKYNKKTGEKVAAWNAPQETHFKHLNSGVVVDGKLYCAHSDWPAVPTKNTIEVWDADKLVHVKTIEFNEGAAGGALTWVDIKRGAWWAGVAHYGEVMSIRKTRVVRLGKDWQPTASWTFPAAVVERFAPYSNSGASFGPNGLLYATGHDRTELYALQWPTDKSRELKLVDTVSAAVFGQGVCWDRSDIGVLYGIRRAKREVVALRVTHESEYAALRRTIRWERDAANPILPPDPNSRFENSRCMNPWVVATGDEYHLYYSGGDGQGRQRICLAKARRSQPTEWDRQGPLFEVGKAGAFDARWCVLPHVVQDSGKWRLYYTGNAGRGAGLSAFPGIGLATSDNGRQWRRHDRPAVISRSGHHGDPDAVGIAGGSLIKMGDQWWFYYTGCPTIGEEHDLNQQKTICLAVSNDGVRWTKRGVVMIRDSRRDYENIGVAGPVVRRAGDGDYRMWYSAIGTKWGFYSICYAESKDGLSWTRGAKYGDNLQLTPTGEGWERRMVEYPSVVIEGDHLRLFYCGNGYGATGIGTAVGKWEELRE
ncbi:MAG: hypothetical protein QF805_03540 [Pirellulaceae bacterium]|nr:hypothetical protein [Pirellulaceae bacterium]